MCWSCRIVGQVHRWQRGLLPPSPCHLYLAFLPMLSLPNLPTSCCPSPSPPNRPQCVMLPSLCPCVLIVWHCLWVRTCGVWFSVLVSVCWDWWFPGSSTSLQRTWTHCFFYGCIVFHGGYVPHFLCPVCHWWAFGLVPSLCYCEQCHNKHMCARVFII